MARTRKPRKPRDYAAEYRRRIASAQRKGKSREEARGHKGESAEKKRRRGRYREQFGATPEQMARLRKEAVEHVVATLNRAGTKGPVDRDTIRDGMMMLDAETLALVATMTAAEFKHYSAMDYDTFILHFPELANAEKRNPFWYHASGVFLRKAA